MDIKTGRLHSILLCFLSISVNMCSSKLIDEIECSDVESIQLFVCIQSLTTDLKQSCDIHLISKCGVVQSLVDCANKAELTLNCINSIDTALDLLADEVDCSRDDIETLITGCYPNGLDSAIIKPIWTDKEITSCSVECGEGTQTWTRECVSDKDPSVTRKGCPGAAFGTEVCQIICEGIVWTEWSDYSECSVTCGDGYKARQRHCVNETHPAELVQGCIGRSTETEPCILDKCKSSGGVTSRVCFLLPLLISIFAGFLY